MVVLADRDNPRLVDGRLTLEDLAALPARGGVVRARRPDSGGPRLRRARDRAPDRAAGLRVPAAAVRHRGHRHDRRRPRDPRADPHPRPRVGSSLSNRPSTSWSWPRATGSPRTGSPTPRTGGCSPRLDQLGEELRQAGGRVLGYPWTSPSPLRLALHPAVYFGGPRRQLQDVRDTPESPGTLPGYSQWLRLVGAVRAREVAHEQAVRVALGADRLEPRPCLVGHEPHLAAGEVAVAEVLADGDRLEVGHRRRRARRCSARRPRRLPARRTTPGRSPTAARTPCRAARAAAPWRTRS